MAGELPQSAIVTGDGFLPKAYLQPQATACLLGFPTVT